MGRRLATARRGVVGRDAEPRLLRAAESRPHLLLEEEVEVVGAEEVAAPGTR
jgi:hypothetical protein